MYKDPIIVLLSLSGMNILFLYLYIEVYFDTVLILWLKLTILNSNANHLW